MTAYIVVQVDVTDAGGYDEYRKMIPPTLEQFGGRFLVRGGRVDNLEGDWNPSRLVVIEFDSTEQARSWWASEEYAPAKALRRQSSHAEMILVEGV